MPPIIWFCKNLPCFCAIIIYLQYCINDTTSADSTATLLCNPLSITSSFINFKGEVKDLEGCYMFYDTVKSKWVQNGKTCGSDTSEPQQTFGVRITEHTKDTRGTFSLRFYSLYPSKYNEKKSDARNGYYEHLRQYAGISIDRHDGLSMIAEVDEGVLEWDNNCTDSLKRYIFNLCATASDKRIRMVSYLIELGYNLKISTSDKVSTSPEFEVCLGVVGGEQE